MVFPNSPLRELIADRELDTGAYTSISVKNRENFAVLSLNVLFQFTPSNWKVVEKLLDCDRCALLAGGHTGTLQSSRHLKIETLASWGFPCLGSNNVEL